MSINFGDPIWQFIGVILAVVAILATFIIYYLQKERKRLSYQILNENRILTFSEELEGRLQVLFEGNPTNDISLLVIKITNTGNKAITATDYETPIKFHTGNDSKILSAAITSVNPSNLNISLVVDEIDFLIQPILLNPKDSIEIKCLVSDYSDSLKVEARIAGVTKIFNSGELQTYQVLSLLFFSLLLILGMTFLIIYDKNLKVIPSTPFMVKVGLALIVIGYLGIGYLFFSIKALNSVLKEALKSFINFKS